MDRYYDGEDQYTDFSSADKSGCLRAPAEYSQVAPEDYALLDLREELLDACELCQYLILHRTRLRRRMRAIEASHGKIQTIGQSVAVRTVMIIVCRILVKDPCSASQTVQWLRSVWQPTVHMAEMAVRHGSCVLEMCTPSSQCSDDQVMLRQATARLHEMNQKLVYKNDGLQRQTDKLLAVQALRTRRPSQSRRSRGHRPRRMSDLQGNQYPEMSDRAIERSRVSIGQRIGRYFDDPRIGFLKSKVKAMWRLLLDPSAATVSKVMVVSALAYLVSPIDAIPDPLPVVGLSDDVAVLMATVANLGVQLAKYSTDASSDSHSSQRLLVASA